jgi:hypothetical protein
MIEFDPFTQWAHLEKGVVQVLFLSFQTNNAFRLMWGRRPGAP